MTGTSKADRAVGRRCSQIKVIVTGIMSLGFLAGCGGGTSQSFNSQPPGGSNPVPTITTISPTSTVAGSAAFMLTINGTNFILASTVNFNGTAPATTFVSATQLTAAIPTAAIASAGNCARSEGLQIWYLALPSSTPARASVL